MKVLVIGGGAREHALVQAIARSPLVRDLRCAPGNPGIARHARCVPIEAADVARLAAYARDEAIDLTVVGPEVPLTLGLAEMLGREGRPVFGPTAMAAEIESSKAFAKAFMGRHGIPTAASETFDSSAKARAWIEGSDAPVPLVVKADGLAAGKGVVICRTRAEGLEAVSAMMDRHVHGEAGSRIVIEEFLEGREVSCFALSDGTAALPLASAQDYKRIHDGDLGPNTGGMGAYAPSVYLDAATEALVHRAIVLPAIVGMAAEGRPYRGVLYAGLMLTASGPKVIEFNARFGDPETQVLMPRLATDPLELLVAAASGGLARASVAWSSEPAVTVVLAAEGYPGSPRKGMPIHGIDAAEAIGGVSVFHAGTQAGSGPEPIVSGGRVLSVTATGASLAEAVRTAYEAAGLIHFDGMQYRRDIAHDALAAHPLGDRS